jgi:RNA exonuclease 4
MVGARTLEQVQADVARLLDGNILVGHSVRNDLDALKLGHPRRDIRDTARHRPFRKLAGGAAPRLKILAAELLGIQIQSGEHSSIEDARATMLLFRQDKDAFEREHAIKWPQRKAKTANNTDGGEKKTKKKKKKTKKKKRR